MQIQVYAVLKDYFEREFTIDDSFATVDQLKAYLIDKNPQAAGILNISRFAVDDEFVDNHFTLKDNDQVSILPPSSGG